MKPAAIALAALCSLAALPNANAQTTDANDVPDHPIFDIRGSFMYGIDIKDDLPEGSGWDFNNIGGTAELGIRVNQIGIYADVGFGALEDQGDKNYGIDMKFRTVQALVMGRYFFPLAPKLEAAANLGLGLSRLHMDEHLSGSRYMLSYSGFLVKVGATFNYTLVDNFYATAELNYAFHHFDTTDVTYPLDTDVHMFEPHIGFGYRF